MKSDKKLGVKNTVDINDNKNKNKESLDADNTAKKTILKTTTKQKLVRSLISLSILGVLFFGIFLALHYSGILSKIDSPDDLKELILSGGVWSYLIFMLIQFLQVTFIPLPAMVTTIAGALVFGPWITYVLSLISVMAGSLFAFWLGKKFGRKMIVWIAGEDDARKWDKKLAHGKYLFFLMLLFPGFPDDVLCMVVGATPMSYKFFIVSNLIARPIVFIPITFLMSGTIIPFAGWGILVWVIIALIGVVTFYLSVKYQRNIEYFLMKTSRKIKRFFSKNKKKRLKNK